MDDGTWKGRAENQYEEEKSDKKLIYDEKNPKFGK
jgi:hypothetical protein